MEEKLRFETNLSDDENGYHIKVSYDATCNVFDIEIPQEFTTIDREETRRLIAFINTHICYIPDKNTISALAFSDKQGLGSDGRRLMEGALWLRELIEFRLETQIGACALPIKSRRNLKQYVSDFNIETPFEVDKVCYDGEVGYQVDLQYFKFKTKKEADDTAKIFNEMLKKNV